MTNPSKPVPVGTPPPSPPPPGPTHPPSRYVDSIFALAVSLGADVAIDSGRDAAGELSSRPVYVTPARPFSTVGRGAQGGPVYSGRDGKGAVERASRPVELPSGGGRAGVTSPHPGVVSESSRAGAGEPLPVLAVAAGGRSGGVYGAPGPGFALPEPVGPPRFGDGPVRPGHPGPPPPPPPTPFPPPGVGPLYDVLPDRDWCDVGWLP